MGVLKRTTWKYPPDRKDVPPENELGEHHWFWCQGCESHHAYTTRLAKGEEGPCWKFDGNLDKPTFSPSLLCNRQILKVCDCQDSEECEDDSHAKPAYGYHRCHLFVEQGMVRFLNDCTHSMAGKTVPIEPPRF